MEWARQTSYPELDPALYHLPSDPKEVKNHAFDPKYQQISGKMQKKLLEIVPGGNRVEVDWVGYRIFKGDIDHNDLVVMQIDGQRELTFNQRKGKSPGDIGKAFRKFLRIRHHVFMKQHHYDHIYILFDRLYYR